MTEDARRIVTVGGGGHGKVVIGLLQRLGYEVLGYTDRVDRGDVLGVPRLGDDTVLPALAADGCVTQAALGVGTVEAAPARRLLARDIAGMGLALPAIVSAAAHVAQEVAVGAGSVVCDGAVVNVGAVIGDFSIVNSNAVVEHDSHLGDNVHVAPGAVLSGEVEVGDDCMIGAGATVRQRVRVCAGTLVGAGSVVLHDITEPGVYVGNPVRRMR